MSRRMRNSMTPKLLLVSVLVVSLAGLGAADAPAAGNEEAKWKLVLYPCDPVGEDDAGGEAEFESDRGLKVEIWGATLLRGETLAIEVDRLRVGTLTVGEDGKGDAELRLELPPAEGHDDFPEVTLPEGDLERAATVFASDRELCSDDESSRSN